MFCPNQANDFLNISQMKSICVRNDNICGVGAKICEKVGAVAQFK